MNSISINNEKYVKATDIARELGYTADYVGQLCRGKKVDAQLVGRSWYVLEDSIRSHKNTRYRSSKTASKKTIVSSLDLETKDLDAKETFNVPISKEGTRITTNYARESFYSRTSLHSVPSYQKDTHDLIPVNTKIKTGSLKVSLGDAQVVKIKSRSQEYNFNPTQRSEVRFKGKLSVQDIYDEDKKEEIPELAKEIQSEETVPTQTVASAESAVVTHEPIVATHKIQVRHLRKDKKKKKQKLPIEHNSNGVLGMQRYRLIARNPLGGTLKIEAPLANQQDQSFGGYFIIFSTVVSLIIAMFIIGLQSDVNIQNSLASTSYTFTFSELMAAVSSWRH